MRRSGSELLILSCKCFFDRNYPTNLTSFQSLFAEARSSQKAPCLVCILRAWKIYITRGVLLFLEWKRWHAAFRELPADLHPPGGHATRLGLRMIRSLLPNSYDGERARYWAHNAVQAWRLLRTLLFFFFFLARFTNV